MSGSVAVRCEGISKRYRVTSRAAKGRKKEEFWALRDITFDIEQGDVVGVVGRNGAGKSTLLKVLSRIIQPTRGRALLRGRLAGLLEVGTGFHPELTGRENVYLNGTILGMTRREVQQQFDSIVEFAGISYFLDTPIKRYSSGMYVRLAFAVAAHLQSEILILDEVLAVGDLAFQRKCLDKVQALAHDEGRTVLLVSHNAEVIRHNATSAIRLDSGRLTVVGTVDEALDDSVAGALPWQADLSTAARVDPNWGRVVRMTSVVMADGGHVPFGGDLRYRVTFQATERLELGVGQAVTGLDEAPIATSFSPLETYEAGQHTVEITVPRIPVAPGSYALNIVIGHASFAVPDLHLDGVMRAVGFTVVDGSMTVDWHPEWWGSVAMAEPRVRRVDVGS